MRGRAAAGRRRWEEAVALAWHVEAFARTKKLPGLDKVLGGGATKRNDDAAVIAMLDGLAARGLVTAG